MVEFHRGKPRLSLRSGTSDQRVSFPAAVIARSKRRLRFSSTAKVKGVKRRPTKRRPAATGVKSRRAKTVGSAGQLPAGAHFGERDQRHGILSRACNGSSSSSSINPATSTPPTDTGGYAAPRQRHGEGAFPACALSSPPLVVAPASIGLRGQFGCTEATSFGLTTAL